MNIETDCKLVPRILKKKYNKIETKHVQTFDLGGGLSLENHRSRGEIFAGIRLICIHMFMFTLI